MSKRVTPKVQQVAQKWFRKKMVRAGISKPLQQTIEKLLPKELLTLPGHSGKAHDWLKYDARSLVAELRKQDPQRKVSVQEAEALITLLQTHQRQERRNLRVWTLEKNMATESSLARRRELPQPFEVLRYVEGKALKTSLKQAVAPHSTTPVAPEDGSLRVRAFHMTAFGLDQTGLEYPKQMARVGLAEGFHVVLLLEAGNRASFEKEFSDFPNLHLVELDTPKNAKLNMWSEDGGQIDRDGNFRLPAIIQTPSEKWTEEGLIARLRRFYPKEKPTVRRGNLEKLSQRIQEEFPLAAFPMVGRVAEDNSSEALAAAAVARGKKVFRSRTHIEGGNLLVGLNERQKTYALVGFDSVEQSRWALRQGNDAPVSDDEVLTAIAEELGLEKENVIAVEQPGDFHIDMAMTLIGPGRVLLNDSVAAQKLSEQVQRQDLEAEKPQLPPNASVEERTQHQTALESWEMKLQMLEEGLVAERAEAERLAPYEGLVLSKLEAAGLKVERAPAAFGTHFNFLNSEQGLNTRDERFYLAAGGPPWAEQVFLDTLLRLSTNIRRVYFLDRRLTTRTFEARGGVSCRNLVEVEAS